MADATPLLAGLPDEIVIWEILVRLSPKSLLRCRPVSRAWRRATSTRSFLQANHGRQPALPIVFVNRSILAFDHRDDADHQLHTVAQLDEVLYLQASCDGLLVLSRYGTADTRFSICNPATRQHAPFGAPADLNVMGMYAHRPTGEYRLLLHRRTQRRWTFADPRQEIVCCVLALGSDQPPRHVGWPDTAPPCFDPPAFVHGNLHWYPSYYRAQMKPVLVFDTIAETFRQMRAPSAPSSSSRVVEIDGTLGVYSRNRTTKAVEVWVLQSYECEVWELKHRIQLPVEEIRGRFDGCGGYWVMDVVSSVDADVILLLSIGPWLLYVDSNGKLVDSFNRGGQGLSLAGFRLKQTLVPHSFFTALEGYSVNASPFI
ncbi:hypothetical protein QYE76_025790 [Lolium multiflorum]|uniref:F-box domain-containing protein n=1 Tax=Lolium multiflorum TaxID=4521 RepID=A0AAD8REQ5_LOLMU|nr:hypothetical protein QYE76_025790 [Lolium multiflorum]